MRSFIGATILGLCCVVSTRFILFVIFGAHPYDRNIGQSKSSRARFACTCPGLSPAVTPVILPAWMSARISRECR